MFYDTNYTFREMVLVWLMITGAWGVSLWIALKLARIELNSVQKMVVVLLAGLALLIPVLGLLLAPALAIYLIYRMADAQLPIIVTAVSMTLFINVVIFILIQRALR